MSKVTVNGKIYEFEIPPTLMEVAEKANIKNVLAAKVNQRLRELSYVIDDNAEVFFLGFEDRKSTRLNSSHL